MNNKKILTGLLLIMFVVGGIGTTFASDSTKCGVKNMNKEFRGKMGDVGHRGGAFMRDPLTDAEKTALESMSDIEKKEFFDKKRIEMEAKMEAREKVIDKILAGTTLTSEEKTIKQEIIKERIEKRAEKRVKMETRKVEMETMKVILEKKKAGIILTSDEQDKLYEFEANRPKMKGFLRCR